MTKQCINLDQQSCGHCFVIFVKAMTVTEVKSSNLRPQAWTRHGQLQAWSYWKISRKVSAQTECFNVALMLPVVSRFCVTPRSAASCQTLTRWLTTVPGSINAWAGRPAASGLLPSSVDDWKLDSPVPHQHFLRKLENSATSSKSNWGDNGGHHWHALMWEVYQWNYLWRQRTFWHTKSRRFRRKWAIWPAFSMVMVL